MENQKECNKCKRVDTGLLKCSACGTVYYCSRDCQKNDWKEHKLTCKHVPASDLKKQEELKKDPEVSKVDLYTKIKKAGDGNFSEIWHVEKKDTKEQFALKAINRQRLQQLHKENDVVMEVHVLTRLDSSEYAVKLYDRFKDELNLYLVTDYVQGGELWDIVRSFGLIAQSLVKYYFCWLLKAVEFIHSKGIIHRDLKPENIMVDLNHRLKLIDFGTARDLENPQVKGAGNSARGKRIFEHFVGTPHYMAPECVRNKDSNLKSDVWSLGCILYQLIAGYPPFLGNSEYLVFQKSLEKEAVFDDFLFSSEVKELITNMIQRDFNNRLSLEEVMKHPYFNGIDFKNLISYEEAVSKIEPYEKLLIDIKEKLYEIEGKEENIKSVIEEGRKKLGESDLSEDLKVKCEKWITMMEQQAKSHFGLGDFTWHKE